MLCYNGVHNESKVTICGHASTQSNENVTLHLRGLSLENTKKAWYYFAMNTTDPYFVILKRHLNTYDGKEHWQAVYQSEYIINHLNPLWNPSAPINLEQLCDGDEDKDLQIEIWEHERNDIDEYVARLVKETRLSDLQRSCDNTKGNADKRNALALKDWRNDVTDEEVVGAGVIVVLRAD